MYEKAAKIQTGFNAKRTCKHDFWLLAACFHSICLKISSRTYILCERVCVCVFCVAKTKEGKVNVIGFGVEFLSGW